MPVLKQTASAGARELVEKDLQRLAGVPRLAG